MSAARAYRISAASGIHKGDREYQQDQVLLLPHPRVKGCLLAVVADGMGGRSGGRKASDQVILTGRQLFERYVPGQDDAKTTLEQMAREAHAVIRLTGIAAEEEPHSTFAAMIIDPDGRCTWAHSGDSRLYHFHGQMLIKRSLDHSYVQTLVDQGQITPEQAHIHPKANILVGCLGIETDPPIAYHVIHALRPGDTLMVCSDGIWHYFTEAELGSVLAALSPREASEFLIDKARVRARGSADNLSLAVVKIDPPRDHGAAQPLTVPPVTGLR
ncbi:MAG: Stp1/IreP family PP2C-type Ser/Thr phosphatase [Rhodoferax sp.]